MKIPKRIASTVINSLKGGVVPRVGLPYITVGREAEIAALLEKFKENDLAFDDLLVRKVVETVQVESAEKLEITFKDGNRRGGELPGRK